MRQILSVAMALVVAVGLAGCTSPGMGSSGMACENCTYGYVPVKKSMERREWCIKDGKMLDCKKNPPECPECAAKAAAQNK